MFDENSVYSLNTCPPRLAKSVHWPVWLFRDWNLALVEAHPKV